MVSDAVKEGSESGTKATKLGARSTGVDAESIASRERTQDEALPWAHISAGVSSGYLWRERERALAGKTTPDCSFSGCTGCDVCDDLDVKIVLAGDSRG